VFVARGGVDVSELNPYRVRLILRRRAMVMIVLLFLTAA
jgi:hypothetical protein